MLKKTARLNRSEFNECFSKGRRYHSLYLTIIVSPYESFKAAVVVSKKVAKKAHDRNRIRRRLYSLLKVNQPQSGRYIVIAKPAVIKLTKGQSQGLLGQEIARVVNNQ